MRVRRVGDFTDTSLSGVVYPNYDIGLPDGVGACCSDGVL